MVFTGLVRALGRVVRLETESNRPARLYVRADEPLFAAHRAGDSICVHGVCLTLLDTSDSSEHVGAFDVMHETLERTSVGTWRAGTRVHLEPACGAATRLDGHAVQGHVDCCAPVLARDTRADGTLWLTLALHGAAQLLPLKDSVALDGISLTVARVDQHAFAVALLPYTCAHTTLGALQVGARCNLELRRDSATSTAARALLNDAEAAHRAVDYMLLAVSLGDEARAHTRAPQPWLGAVLVDTRSGRVVSSAHSTDEAPHPEHVLLCEVHEPSHFLLYCTLDPRVCRARWDAMRASGVRVLVGVTLDSLASESDALITVLDDVRARKSLAAYLHWQHSGTPYVHAAMQVALDGGGQVSPDARLPWVPRLSCQAGVYYLEHPSTRGAEREPLVLRADSAQEALRALGMRGVLQVYVPREQNTLRDALLACGALQRLYVQVHAHVQFRLREVHRHDSHVQLTLDAV